MKSLLILFGLLAVTLGSLSTGNVGVPIAPLIPLRGGQYRVESASADGSVAGQYGYQIDGQHFQQTYSTAGQSQDANSQANNDQTYTSGTTSEVTTPTGVKTEDTPKTEDNQDTKTTTTLLTTVPIQSVTTPVTQTYGANYPTAQQPSYYYVKPSGFYPTQQQFSYSQSSPFTGYYIPNYINGQQYLYPRPTFTYTVGGSPNTGSSPGLISTQVYTPGPAGQVPIAVAPVYQTGGIPIVTGQTGATTYTGQPGAATYTGQSIIPVVNGQTGATTYTGQTGAPTYTGQTGATTYTGQPGATTYSGQTGATTYTGQIGATTYTGQTGAATYTGQSIIPVVNGQTGATTYTGQTGATTYTGQSGATTYPGQGVASPVYQKAVVTPASGQIYSGQRVEIIPTIPSRRTSGVYSSNYGYSAPALSYRSYYPVHPYHGFAQSYGYPRFHYRVNRY